VRSITVGVVDYGMGNQASVIHSLRGLGVRVRMGDTPDELDGADLLILPGVGAFPAAMAVLHQKGLVSYLKDSARNGRPLIGICLGMQLLMSGSYEHGYTEGLDLIPGEVIPFDNQSVHIGWNTLELTCQAAPWSASDGEAFYFNHSYFLSAPQEYRVAITRHLTAFTSILQRGKVVGLQFHPEKSQTAGKALLKNLITELTHA
jgi:imidazole glycerol-phosphate synthase subunit HisH